MKHKTYFIIVVIIGAIIYSRLLVSIIFLHDKTVNQKITMRTNENFIEAVKNIYPGGFLNNISSCDSNINKLLIIYSSIENIKQRDAIRKSWGKNYDSSYRLIFIIGTNNISQFPADSFINNDIIICNFIDSYKNLTLKTMCMLEWAINKCNKINYLVKCDDDVFVNLNRLSEILNKYKNENNIILGNVVRQWKPMRDKKSKYYISNQEYEGNFLPNFTTGPMYIIKNDLLLNLYNTALNEKFLFLEDVFIVGIVGTLRLKAKLIHMSAITNRRPLLTVCTIGKKFISVHNVKYNEHEKLNRLSNLSTRSCK